MERCLVLGVLMISLSLLCMPTQLAMAKNSSSSADESALLAFKAAITSDPFQILSNNWSHQTPYCDWIGVICNGKHKRVRELNLFNVGLAGTIPKEIGNLKFLATFNISSNNFHGNIPHTIGFLTNLQSLDIGDNEFDGSIPPQIGNSSKLQKLILHRNNLTGDLPGTVFNISSLVVLDLQTNEISGILPNDLCYLLPQLEYLDIAINYIHGEIPEVYRVVGDLKLPNHIGNMSSLEELYIARMNLTGSLPNEIGKLSNLREFRAFQNQLTGGTLPASVSNISTLENFVVADNNLDGNIPLELGKLSRLKGLSLRSNNFSGEIPSSIFNISGLQVIELSFNNLSGNLQPGLRHWVSPSLLGLILATNQFTGTIPSSISNASQLEMLDLGDNMFSGHVPLAIANLDKLEVFSIENNRITNDPSANELSLLTSLSKCKNLKGVVLSGNPFNTVLPNMIDIGRNKSLSLEKLYATDCHFKGNIPSGISNFSNLIVLDLSNNKLSGSFSKTLEGLQRLQGLYLGNNAIKGSLPNTLCLVKDLSELHLEHNKLTGQIPSCFGNISSLRRIYLGSKLFTSTIPLTFWNNKDVLRLDLSSNFLSGSLSPEIGSMHNMVELNLSGNQFSGEIPDTIGKLQNLLILSLSSNRLRGPIPQSFDSLISLQQLDLSNNSLSGGIPKSMEKLKDLVYLNLSFNDLSGKIPNGGPFAKFSQESFMGNKELCGASRFHVMECRENKEKPAIFLKYVFPPLVSVVVVILLVLLITLWKRSKRRAPQVENSLDVTLKRISYYEILRATEDFDVTNLIGKGSFSSVFKGNFADGVVAAIKVFNLDVQDSIKSFDAECQVLRNIRHRNLVKRLGIMMEVANALEYLHQGHSFSVVHCDLKPGNILLDENMVAHVGDYGIAKLLDKDNATKQTNTIGTVGYMAPEYGSAGMVSVMGDVYGFGILLMEVFTRKKPTDEMFQGDFTIRRWVSDSLPDAIMQIVDSNLLTGEEGGGQEIEQCFVMMMGLAMECTADFAEERITMKDVIVKLKHTQQKFNQNGSIGLVIN